MNEALVPIKTNERGLFQNDARVVIVTDGGEERSLFVDKSLISSDNGQDFLKVFATSSGGFSKILLPSETFETLSRWVSVKNLQQV
jgi:hypothetical protein